MTSVLAIISAAALAGLEKQHGACEPGSVLPLDRYLSRHRALEPLSEGGTLYLAAVRQPGERLWLVAALRFPQAEAEMWTAEANVAPITDITDLVGSLRFSSGKGLTAAPGKLAMSLQTPRALTEDDQVLLEARVSPSARAAYEAARRDALPPRKAAKAAVKPAKKGQPDAIAALAPVDDLDLVAALANIDDWRRLSKGGKERVLAELVERLAAEASGPSFELAAPHVGSDGLGVLRDTETGHELVVVPGGVARVGFAPDDMLTCWAAADLGDVDEAAFQDGFRSARPPRWFRLPPFLVARRGAPCAEDERDDYLAAAARRGYREIREVEWEWCAQEGGAVSFVGMARGAPDFSPNQEPAPLDPTGFGLHDFIDEPCRMADAFHPTWDTALETGDFPPGPGDAPRALRLAHTQWQSREELIAWHRAARACESEHTQGTLRLVRDLPCKDAALDLLAGVALPTEAPIARLLEAIGGKTPDRKRALRVLDDLATDPAGAPEAPALLAHLVKGDPAWDPKVHLHALRLGVRLAEDRGAREERPGARAAARAALASHEPTLAARLGDATPNVRAHALYALSRITPSSATRAAVLELAQREKQEPTRMAAFLCLGAWLAREQDTEAHELLAGAVKGRSAPLASVAALALALGTPLERLPEGGLLRLCQALGLKSKAADALPFWDGNLRERAFAILRNASEATREEAARSLLAPLEGPDAPSARIVALALALLFPPRPNERETVRPEALSPMARRLLELTAEREVDAPVDFESYAVPRSLALRRALIGLGPRLPSDRLVRLRFGEEDVELPLWRASERIDAEDDDRAREALKKLVAGLSPLERLALWLDPRRLRDLDLPGSNQDQRKLIADAETQDRGATVALAQAELARLDDLRARGAEVTYSTVLRLFACLVEPGKELDPSLLGHLDLTLKESESLPEEVWRTLPRATAHELLERTATAFLDEELADLQTLRTRSRGEKVVDAALLLKSLRGLKLGLLLMAPFGARWKAEEIEPTLGAWPEAKSFVATFNADYAKVSSVRAAVDFIIAQRPNLGV
ncbi:hypothetical protein [Sorangium sp. So ce128]|uniref:hypothetical protein n=1 Tax=Sorangium sp. So ce128 TaxID=3133281 RepID=UPI003F60036F